ncbi:MAG: TRAP transporter large permease [Kofleriaceae bacterium]|nr:TRAP transporter large permease [Kofleriaceae bacterium]
MMTLLIILLVLVFISGAPLFTVMLAGTALGTYYSKVGFEAGFDAAIVKLVGTSGRDEIEVLSTIPMFIFAGYMLAESKAADRIVRFANALLGWLPGGLAIVTIFTCAIFTTFTGASGVTIIALGGVLMPALVKNGYPERFSMGLIAGTGAVGLLFPPAVPLFIYGTVYGLTGLDKENWTTKQFLGAGIVPGLVLIGMLSAVAVFVAIKKRLPRQKFEVGELGKSFAAALPELMIPIGVLLLLAKGIYGPQEVAALTVVYVMVLEFWVFRTLTLKMVWAISWEAMAMIGAIFMIILASTAFTNFAVDADIPNKLVEVAKANVSSKIVFLLAINLVLLVVGTVMDIFSAIVVVLPLIAPIAKAYGIDPYHLGVIFLLNLEVGYLHPPVGLNLFLTSVKFQRPITEVMWATVPFLVTMVIALLVITYVPALTVVPEQERRSPVNNLVVMVETGLDESKVSMPTINLVDAFGKELKDGSGKPVTRKFTDCKAVADENERNVCQQLFFDVSDCMPDAAKADAKQKECAYRAIAKWTVSNMNGDAQHPEYAIMTMAELPLVDGEGKPIEWDEPVLDKDGQPVLDPDTSEPKTEHKPLLAADGKPLVKKLATCDKFTGTEKDTCRELFAEASSCYIDPPDVADCVAEKVAECSGAAPAETPAPADGAAGSAAGSGSAAASSSGSAATGSAAASGAGSATATTAGSADDSAVGSGAGSAEPGKGIGGAACTEQAIAACIKPAIASCVVDKVTSWLEDYPEKAKLE